MAFGLFPSIRFGLEWGGVPDPVAPTTLVPGSGIQVDFLGNATMTFADDRVGVTLATGYTIQSLGATRSAMLTQSSGVWLHSVPFQITFAVSPIGRLALQASAALLVGTLSVDRRGAPPPEGVVAWRVGGGLNWVALNFPGAAVALSLDVNYTSATGQIARFGAVAVVLGLSMSWFGDIMAVRPPRPATPPS